MTKILLFIYLLFITMPFLSLATSKATVVKEKHSEQDYYKTSKAGSITPAKSSAAKYPLGPETHVGRTYNSYNAGFKRNVAFPSITIEPILFDRVNPDSLFEVSFTTTENFNAGNTFTIQLSDASGSFASPVNIGVGTASPIHMVIPTNTPAGIGYRIRIVASSPAVTSSDNGSDIIVVASHPYIQGDLSVCAGNASTYVVNPVSEVMSYPWSYTWSVPTGWQITSGQGTTAISVLAGNTSGAISVAATNHYGGSQSATLTVTIASEITNNVISSSQPTCLGSAPNLLLGSSSKGGNEAGGHSLSWQSSLDGTNFMLASGVNYGQNYSPGVLTQTTWFRRLVKAGSCEVNISNVVKVDVVPSPAAPLTVANYVLSEPGTQTLAIANPEANFSYNWYASANGGVVLGRGISYQTPQLTTGTTYFVSAVNGIGCESSRTRVVVTVNSEEPVKPELGAILGAVSLCTGQSNVAYSITAIPNATQYTWAVPAGWTITEGQNTPTIKVQPGSTGGEVSVTVTGTWGTSIIRRLRAIIIPPITSNTIFADQTVDDGFPPALLVGSTPQGGDGIYAYLWESSTSGPASGFVPASGSSNELNYNPGLLLYTTWFRRKIVSQCETAISEVVKITIKHAATPTITMESLSGIETCAGAIISVHFSAIGMKDPGTLFLVEFINPYTSTTEIISASATSPVIVAIPSGLKNTGIYYLRIVTDTPNVIASPNTDLFLVGDLAPSQPSLITGDPAPCAGTMNLKYSVEVMPGAYAYEWTVPEGWLVTAGKFINASKDNTADRYTNHLTVTAGPMAGVISVVGLTPCGRSLARTIAVNPVSVTAPAVAGASQCDSGPITLTATGAPGNGEYRWYTAATGGTALATAAVYTTPTLIASTNYYVSVVANGCESARTKVAAIVNVMPVVQAGAIDSICLSADPSILSGFSPAGGTWTGAGVTADGVFDPANAGVGTHILQYTITAPGCTASDTKTVVVTEVPTVTLAPFINSVCNSATHFILTGGLPAGGTYTGIGVTDGIFNAATAGTGTHEITYTYTIVSGCVVATKQNLTVLGTCQSYLEENLATSPNPASSLLQVNLPLPAKTDITLRLLDSKGVVVYEQQYTQVAGQFKQTLDIQYNAKGIYTLHLILDKEKISKRIVIQ